MSYLQFPRGSFQLTFHGFPGSNSATKSVNADPGDGCDVFGQSLFSLSAFESGQPSDTFLPEDHGLGTRPNKMNNSKFTSIESKYTPFVLQSEDSCVLAKIVGLLVGRQSVGQLPLVQSRLLGSVWERIVLFLIQSHI